MPSILRLGFVVLASLVLAVSIESATGAGTHEINLQRPEKAGSLFRIHGIDERLKVTRIRRDGVVRDESKDIQRTEVSMAVQVTEVNSFGEISRAMITVEKLNRGGQQVLAHGTVLDVTRDGVSFEFAISGAAINANVAAVLRNALEMTHSRYAQRLASRRPKAIGDRWASNRDLASVSCRAGNVHVTPDQISGTVTLKRVHQRGSAAYFELSSDEKIANIPVPEDSVMPGMRVDRHDYRSQSTQIFPTDNRTPAVAVRKRFALGMRLASLRKGHDRVVVHQASGNATFERSPVKGTQLSKVDSRRQ